uniref:Uncharacterized protein n=1 Tax=Setaria viridis TaxID=4556 RepID=A0A4U6WAS6_SETVI|nr:hypothetical protein SEVIR_1G196100v2 [Setaria viridis]
MRRGTGREEEEAAEAATARKRRWRPNDDESAAPGRIGGWRAAAHMEGDKGGLADGAPDGSADAAAVAKGNEPRKDDLVTRRLREKSNMERYIAETRKESKRHNRSRAAAGSRAHHGQAPAIPPATGVLPAWPPLVASSRRSSPPHGTPTPAAVGSGRGRNGRGAAVLGKKRRGGAWRSGFKGRGWRQREEGRGRRRQADQAPAEGRCGAGGGAVQGRQRTSLAPAKGQCKAGGGRAKCRRRGGAGPEYTED